MLQTLVCWISLFSLSCCCLSVRYGSGNRRHMHYCRVVRCSVVQVKCCSGTVLYSVVQVLRCSGVRMQYRTTPEAHRCTRKAPRPPVQRGACARLCRHITPVGRAATPRTPMSPASPKGADGVPRCSGHGAS